MAATFLFFFAIDAVAFGADSSAFERLTLVGPDAAVIAVVEGGPAGVTISPEIDRLLLTPGARITMVHNHPRSGGFSCADLLHLGKAGVVSVVVVGADGSRYEARRGARYDADGFETAQCEVARTHIRKMLAVERGHDPLLPPLDAHIAHLTSVALQRAGVIRYEATLSRGRKTEWFLYRPVLGHVAESAAARVREVDEARAAHDARPTPVR